jgi:hypothetical protein
MTRLTLVLTVLLLTACATEAKYQIKLDALKGTDELGLIRHWGPPDRIFELYGHRFLVYRRSQAMIVPGAEPIYQTTFSGKTAYTHGYGGTPDTIMNLDCTTTFEIVDGKISDSSFRGSDCTSD